MPKNVHWSIIYKGRKESINLYLYAKPRAPLLALYWDTREQSDNPVGR